MSKELVAGQKIEQYEVISTLGAGGMSRVYLCQDLVLNRRVALKQILLEQIDSRGVIRLQQEGQALARLSHPNIVKIISFVTTTDGVPFLVMELLSGCSLDELLLQRGSLSPGEVVLLAHQLCDALQHAHDEGIVHRDIKPSNVFLCNKRLDSVKIIDFGIAKILDSNVNATRTGEFLGSPAYLSPEQALQKATTTQSDQYSLGCVLYECLTGRPPFEDATAVGLILKHVSDEPAPLGRKSFVPPALAHAIERSLKKNPDFRFASMSEFKDALEGKSAVPRNTRVLLLAASLAVLISMCIAFCAIAAYWSAKVSTPAIVKRAPQFERYDDVLTLPNDDTDTQWLKMKILREPEVQVLSLRNRHVSTPGLNELIKAKALKELEMGRTNLDDRSGDYLSKIRSLENLDVSMNDVTDSFVEKIKTLPKLKVLALNKTLVTEKCLNAIAEMPSIRAVYLDNDKKMSDIASLQGLPLLCLSLKNDLVVESTINQLLKIKTLDSLTLDQNAITDGDLKLLAGLPKLRNLLIHRCPLLTPAGIAAFRKMKPGCHVESEPSANSKYSKTLEFFTDQ